MADPMDGSVPSVGGNKRGKSRSSIQPPGREACSINTSSKKSRRREPMGIRTVNRHR